MGRDDAEPMGGTEAFRSTKGPFSTIPDSGETRVDQRDGRGICQPRQGSALRAHLPAGVVFAVALLLRMLLFVATTRNADVLTRDGDALDYHVRAVSLLEGRGFSRPFHSGVWGPDARRTPAVGPSWTSPCACPESRAPRSPAPALAAAA